MGNYWASLSSRERGMVVIALLAVILIPLYAFVLDPHYTRLSQLRSQVPEKRETLVWMQQQSRTVAPLLRKKPAGGGTDTSIPLLTVIEQTATQQKLRSSIRRMQPGENNDVKLWLSELYFDPWVQWVGVLKQQGIELLEASVDKDENNRVSIRATLSRAN